MQTSNKGGKMRVFDKLNSETLSKATIGDIFAGYGTLGNGAVLKYNSYENNIRFAIFTELKKDGHESKFEFNYSDGSIGNSHRKRG